MHRTEWCYIIRSTCLSWSQFCSLNSTAGYSKSINLNFIKSIRSTIMSNPLLFCPAFKSGTHSDRTQASVGLRRKRKKRRTHGEELDFESKSSTPAPKTYKVIEEGEIEEKDASSQSDPGTSEDEDASPTSSSSSSSSSWRKPSRKGWLTNGPPRSDGLRRQHLAAVSAILHRCLLQGDYVRAGRAWALLLRSEVDGHPMDLRREDRWGIGAEILLQNSLSQQPDGLKGDSSLTVEDYDEMSTTDTRSRGGRSMQPAQDYYDRLIVQYPYRNASAKAVSSLDFYPVLFGLRIFSEQHNRACLFGAPLEHNSGNESGSKDPSNPNRGSPSPEVSSSEHQRSTGLVEYFINHGEEIANQLDELLSSPPYSDDVRLQNLRTMVGLWIEDLHNSPYFHSTSIMRNQRNTQ